MLVPPHSLNNIEITNYFKYEPRFNDIFSINWLPRTKDREYVLNLADKNSKGIIWVSLFIDKNIVVYFNFLGIEYIPQELSNKIKDKSVTHHILGIHDDESGMCGFYCIAFIGYIFAGKTSLDCSNLFSPNHRKKND